MVDLWCGNLRRTDKWFGKHCRSDDAPCWGPYDGMEEDPLQPSHWMPIAGPPEKEQAKKAWPIRWYVARGKTIDEMRANLSQAMRDTGDCKLIWVNEGDLLVAALQETER